MSWKYKTQRWSASRSLAGIRRRGMRRRAGLALTLAIAIAAPLTEPARSDTVLWTPSPEAAPVFRGIVGNESVLRGPGSHKAAAVSAQSGNATTAVDRAPSRRPLRSTLALIGMVLLATIVAGLLLQRVPMVRRRTDHLWRRLDALALGVRKIVTIDEIDPDTVWPPFVLHERGWPVDLMIGLLGRPDYAVIDPTGRRDPCIVLSRARVEAIEQGAKFRAYFEERNKEASREEFRAQRWMELQKDDPWRLRNLSNDKVSPRPA